MKNSSKFIKTYQGFIISIVLSLASFFLIILGIIPAVGKIKNNFEKSKLISAENEIIQKRISILNSLDEESLNENMILLLSAIPKDINTPSLINYIDELSALSGVAIDSFHIDSIGSLDSNSVSTKSAGLAQKSVKSSAINSLKTVISIRGNLEQIRNFISLSSRSRRLWKITHLELSFREPTNIKANIQGLGYFYDSPETFAKNTKIIDSFSQSDEDFISSLAAMRLLGQSVNGSENSILRLGNKENIFVP